MGSAESSFVITGMGMKCALGQDAVQSCAAIRAGISGFRQWPSTDSPPGESGVAITGAPSVPDPGDLSWVVKLEGLATQPLLEALWSAGLQELTESGNPTRWGLYLAVPPPDRPGVDEEDAQEFFENLHGNTLFPFELDSSTILSNGHSGALMALGEAMRDLEKGSAEVCIVGGVDSLLETGYLSHLLGEKKLKTDDCPAGLIPGEAAAFLVLETADRARARGANALACVTPVRRAFEMQQASADPPGRGDALARVLKEALSDAPCEPSEIHRIINDLNGERWRFLEWAMAGARSLTRLPPYRSIWHPADCFGDIGAASGAAHLCMATRAFQRGYAAGRAILVSNSSDGGERVAAVVSPASQNS